jgi:hypothetical protein
MQLYRPGTPLKYQGSDSPNPLPVASHVPICLYWIQKFGLGAHVREVGDTSLEARIVKGSNIFAGACQRNKRSPAVVHQIKIVGVKL